MNTEKLETAAVNKFIELIDNCDHLKAKFAENDRTRLTDGEIEVFRSDEHSNSTFEARVSVQVRGRSVRNRTQTYKVSRIELEGYRKLHGVILLVGFKVDGKSKLEPFYSILGPNRISALLDKFKPAQNNKTIQLHRFPSGIEEIEAIVKYARRMYRESSFVSLDESIVEVTEGVSVYSARPLDLDHPLRLNTDEDDFRIELKTKFGDIVLANVDIEVVPSSYVLHSVGFEVSSGGAVYQDVQQRSIDERTVETKLSDGISLVFRADSDSAEVTIMGQVRLSDRLRDLEFLSSLKRGEALRFGGNSTHVVVGQSENEEYLEAELLDLRMFAQVLEKFRVNLDLIELSEITQKQANQMRKLHGCLFEGEPATENRDEPGRIRQPFAGMALELIRLKDAGDAVWRYEGLTNPESGIYMAQLSRKDGDSKYIPVTPYDLIRPENYPQTLNFRFDTLVQTYERIVEYEDMGSLANQTVLNLIRSADAAPMRSDEFLDAAESLNSWLKGREPKSRVNQINEWQINKRRGELTKEEQESVRRMRRSASGGDEESLFSSLSCSILLEDANEVDSLVHDLSDEQRETFESYPIWDFYKASMPDKS